MEGGTTHVIPLVAELFNAWTTLEDLSRKMSVNEICGLAMKTKYYNGLGGSFPALEKKVKFALQGTRLCFKEVCTDSGTLDVGGAGSFLSFNPVWTPGAIQHVVEVLEEHKCSKFMVLASGKNISGAESKPWPMCVWYSYSS